MSPELPTVVLVDDAAEVRALVRTHLRLSRRFTVVGEGGTGTEAVALAQEHRPALMLLDVSMPEMDGLEALPQVLAVSPATRVVLFSGFDEQGLAERGAQLGAAGFLEKSESLTDLADRLEALSRRTPDAAPADAVPPPADAVPPAAADERGGGGARAASVLGEHLERFREVFEEAAIGMATLTLAGRVVRVNRHLATLLDARTEELVGRPYAELSGSSCEEITRAVTELAAGRAAVRAVEHPLTGPDGPRVAVSTLASVRGDRGQPLYLFVQARDVTAERRAQEQLRQSEERMRLLVESVGDYAIFMLDPQGRVVSWNSGAQRAKGYSAEEIVGQHFRRFYPPDKQQSRHPEQELEWALRDGRYEEEGWRVRKDGSTFWANVVITAVHNDSGQHVGFAKVTRDITERRAAAEQLRQSEERFRLLVEAVEDYAIFMLDPDGRIVSWNAGAQRAKGYTADEIVGEHFRIFYPPDKQQARHPEEELELALRDGRYEEEGWRVRKDGSTFWASVVITAVRNADGEHVGFAKVTRDVTERRLATVQSELAAQALAVAKDELEVSNVQLARAAADQADFLAVTAHELRGPVGVLGGSATTLAQHWPQLTDDERAELFEGMVGSATRVRRLLSDLLTAARLEAGAVELQLQPVPVLRALVAAAAAAGQDRPKDEVLVEAPDDLRVLADPDRFAQVAENLLANALTHGAAPVLVRAVVDGDRVLVRVSDAGPGVAEDMAGRLFERFATGNRRGGTGLGLYIVRELARAQDGDAWYEPARAGSPAAFAVSLRRA